jgi:hypothetical protein
LRGPTALFAEAGEKMKAGNRLSPLTRPHRFE